MARAKPVIASTVTHDEYKALFLIQSGILFQVYNGTTLWLVTFLDGTAVLYNNDDDVLILVREYCTENNE